MIDRRSMRLWRLLLLSGLFVLAIDSHQEAIAQSTCPSPIPAVEDNGTNLIPTLTGDPFAPGRCSTDEFFGAGAGNAYGLAAVGNFAARIILLLPDNDTAGDVATNGARLLFKTAALKNRTAFDVISCPGATSIAPFAGSEVQEIDLPDGGSCKLFAAAPIGAGGELVSLDGTLKRNGNVYSVENGVVTGDVFGGTVVLPVQNGSGTNESETLGQQQKAASTLVVKFQSQSLGDGVFDHLGDAFNGGGNGPQVSANGVSASTTNVANWIGQKQQQKFERQLADLPRDENGNDIYVAPVASLFPRHQQKWNAWIKGNWIYYDGDGSSFDGYTIDVLAGFDYKVDNSVVIGLLGGYGNTDFNTVTGGTKGAFEADGYTVGPYIGVKLSDNVQFDALAAYTYSDYDNRVGVTMGDFIAHRVTVGAQLKGRWEQDNFFIEPGVRVLYAEEDQDAYTDSTGVRQSSLTIKAGRVSVGPKIGYTHTTEDGETIRPWVSVRGEYDFSNQGNVPSSGLPDLDDLLSARVSAGVDATTKDGLNISVQGDVSGLGSGEYTAYGGTARIDVPF